MKAVKSWGMLRPKGMHIYLKHLCFLNTYLDELAGQAHVRAPLYKGLHSLEEPCKEYRLEALGLAWPVCIRNAITLHSPVFTQEAHIAWEKVGLSATRWPAFIFLSGCTITAHEMVWECMEEVTYIMSLFGGKKGVSSYFDTELTPFWLLTIDFSSWLSYAVHAGVWSSNSNAWQVIHKSWVQTPAWQSIPWAWRLIYNASVHPGVECGYLEGCKWHWL